MAQAGIQNIVGTAVRLRTPAREWFILGIFLGNFLPDAGSLALYYVIAYVSLFIAFISKDADR